MKGSENATGRLPADVESEAGQQSVSELDPHMSGRWRVITHGSEHVFDLDACTYRRTPFPGHGRFSYDGVDVALTRVERWPHLGGTFLIWVDDPDQPELVEHWHQSSAVVSIVRALPGG